MPKSYSYQYTSNGSAAYTAVPKPRPAKLPEEKPIQQPKQTQRTKLVVAPVAVIGLLVTAFLLLMVVYSYVQLYETTTQVGKLESQLSSAQADTAKLRSTYESRIDLAWIEARAKELGMTLPSARQTVYLNIAGADHAEVLQVDERSYLEKAWDAVTGSFSGMLEYFH